MPDAIRLTLPRGEDDERPPRAPTSCSAASPPALAVARFAARRRRPRRRRHRRRPAARARRRAPRRRRLAFDPVAGLFGLAFASNEGPLADAAVRRALAMAIDREALAAALNVPAPDSRGRAWSRRASSELPTPAQPDWAAAPLATAPRGRRSNRSPSWARTRRSGSAWRCRTARATAWSSPICAATGGMIGVEAERVPAGRARRAPPDRRGRAGQSRPPGICAISPARSAGSAMPRADQALLAARLAPRAAERQAQFAVADRILTELAPFIPLTAPVRWSLVSQRLDRLPAQPLRPSPGGRADRGDGSDHADRPDGVRARRPTSCRSAATRPRCGSGSRRWRRCSSAPSPCPAPTAASASIPIVGLIPVVGDLVTAAMGAWLVWEATQSRHVEIPSRADDRQCRLRHVGRRDPAASATCSTSSSARTPATSDRQALARQASSGDEADRGRGREPARALEGGEIEPDVGRRRGLGDAADRDVGRRRSRRWRGSCRG